MLAFTPAAALDLLRAPGDLGELVIPGASLPYLAALARFADGLAARGRVLPVLIAEGSYTARWRPVLGGADTQRARDLAGAMPPRAGPSPGSRRETCSPPRSTASPTPRRAPACPVPSCPRGAAVLRLRFLWPNGTWPH